MLSQQPDIASSDIQQQRFLFLKRSRKALKKIKEQFEENFENVLKWIYEMVRRAQKKKKQIIDKNNLVQLEYLVKCCYQKYAELIEQVLHSDKSNHLSQYNKQLHKNSTGIKQNLLQLLAQEKDQNKIYQHQIIIQQNRLKQLQQAQNIWENKYQKAEQQIANLRIDFGDTQKAFSEMEHIFQDKMNRIKNLQDQLADKEMQLLALKQNNQIHTMNRINHSRFEMQLQSWNKENDWDDKSRRRPKTTVRICGQKSRKKIKQEEKQYKINAKYVSQQDLTRMLLLQALTIQQNLLQSYTQFS